MNVTPQLQALRDAVDAKIAYWAAMGELEETLGYIDGNVPDKVNDIVIQSVNMLVSELESGASVQQAHLDKLMEDIE